MVINVSFGLNIGDIDDETVENLLSTISVLRVDSRSRCSREQWANDEKATLLDNALPYNEQPASYTDEINVYVKNVERWKDVSSLVESILLKVYKAIDKEIEKRDNGNIQSS